MCTAVKPLQLRKAEFPMVVTLSGIATLVKPLQPEKALVSMRVTGYPWNSAGMAMVPAAFVGIIPVTQASSLINEHCNHRACNVRKRCADTTLVPTTSFPSGFCHPMNTQPSRTASGNHAYVPPTA